MKQKTLIRSSKFVIPLLTVLLFATCKTPHDVNNQDGTNAEWSAFDPLSIPYDVRLAELEKENIVPNFSFEKGEEQENDSLVTNFKLEGWEVVGEKVEWTNSQSEAYTIDDASHENRAIKISRTSADVQEVNNQANGILSDYIEVIPGNYLFFFDVRLERVFPENKRLNSKIGKSIDIHLEFYDKDKKRLGDGIYFEYYNKEVDNSFKGFSFSNLYYIDKFEWGRVRGRTLNYPFSEGDMPDGCRYVKIFFGLKGAGKMWVDNVDFRFSRWNFTSLERIKPMFDSTYHRSELIIPTPQVIENKQTINLSGKKLTIIMPEAPKKAEIAAKNLLVEKLQKYNCTDTTILTSLAYQPSDNEIIISLGTNYLSFQKDFNTEKTENNPQGYSITHEGNTVFLKGNSDVGNFYAATTFAQLFDFEKDELQIADIYDFPDFDGRSTKMIHYKNEWTIQNDTSLTEDEKAKKIEELYAKIEYEKQLIDYYAFYKMNKTYNGYGDLSKKWWEPGKFFEMLYTELGKSCEKYGGAINTCVMLNPYFHFDYEAEEGKLSDSLRNIFSHSSPEGINKIKNVYKTALDNNAKTVMLCADDFVPHAGTTRGEYTLFTDQDKKQFYNVAHAQNQLITELKTWVDDNYDSVRFEFCPAPYLNQFIDYSMGSAEGFFRDLTSHLPADVAIIWTGNTVRSLSYDDSDIRRYTSHIKRKPMVWDNTPYARYLEGEYGGYPAHYPLKAVMCSLFEPFDIIYPEDYAEQLDNHYYSNLGGSGELNKIQYASFADFTWNTNSYDADFSLFKTLVTQYGEENALALLEFNDTYFRLVSVWAKIRNGKENNVNYQISQTDIDKGNKLKDELNEKYNALQNIENELLLEELKSKMDKKFEQFDEIIIKDAKDKTGHRQT